MNSGLDIGHSLTARVSTAFDPSAYMVFGVRDMAAFAATGAAQGSARHHWNYTNGNTLLLSKIIRDKTGGDAASRAGLRSARAVRQARHASRHPRVRCRGHADRLQPHAGLGARLGALRPALPERRRGRRRAPAAAGWVDYSAAPTPGSEYYGYAAGFWTNRGDGEGQRYRIARGMPADAFFARGATGQYIIVVPSQRLVVARFGSAFTPRDDMDVVARLVADVIATMPPS